MTTSLVGGSGDPLQVGGSPGHPAQKSPEPLVCSYSKSPLDGCGASLNEVLRKHQGRRAPSIVREGTLGGGGGHGCETFLLPQTRTQGRWGSRLADLVPLTMASDGDFPLAFISLATPWIIACQAPLSVGFSRQEYGNGSPFPSLAHLPNPEIKPTSPVSPALQVDSSPTEPSGKSSLKAK